ncbi:hypothetical protein N8T08_009734 [Aspergillus melleus]|uniref:Uncharacterized protein n=1 Tax=Aspergillus melleus TaxID=138277 RepID=A0ACC3AT41_9EURO|nr:hypothetical protein N8T08_009734 [Aspergillus melleus]
MTSLFAWSLILPAAVGTLHPRVQDGLARTPPMGWNTYNNYNCKPNESIVRSNAKALVDLGLASAGYHYVTVDCGWTVSERPEDGLLTWNETLFPGGFPALGQYIHDLGLLFGAYGDSGIKLCGSPPDNVGNLYHEEEDAKTYASWGVDALKYDNCFSDAETGYPNVNYAPSTSPHPRFVKMSNALAQTNRSILFQVCEWGIDFPALWAPSIGHTWRIGNDILPAWRSIFRTLNQAVPQTSFAGPGQWPDLDMLEVGNGVLTVPEEQTHFSLWAILKSPLTIGAALKDDKTSIDDESLAILKNTDVIGYNQDKLGVSASFRRRWADEGYEVWSGPLSGGRTVAALINWNDEARDLTLNLPDVGLQSAGILKNIWEGSTARDVKTSYTARVEAHGTILVELQDTVASGRYPTNKFASPNGQSTTFKSVYANTTSNKHTLTIHFSEPLSTPSNVTIATNAGGRQVFKVVPPSSEEVSLSIPLVAGSNNSITIRNAPSIGSIAIQSPRGTYHPSTEFTVSGSARKDSCGSGFCEPVGSRIRYISPNGTARAIVPATAGSKYIEIDYTNNDVAFDSAWDWGRNTRNLTVAINGGKPVRVETPLSGKHSELFGPGLGWWDTATMGVLTDGWKDGDNDIVIGNVGGEQGVESYGADFVGLTVYS